MQSQAVQDMPGPRVVILNDTSGRNHHGCARVMRLLIAGLESRGARVVARAPAHADWRRDAGVVQALATANLVVINGEGTLHHGRPAGAMLLSVVEAVPDGCPVALVNALYQDNPAEWAPWLDQLALISARDGASADELRKATRVPVRVVPDLSLSEGEAHGAVPRGGLVFGDAVRLQQRRALARAALRTASPFLPIKTLRSPVWRWPVVRQALFCAYNGVFTLRPSRMRLARDEADYLARISRAATHVTGRFHSVCLSLVTRTPFLAVASNSWKVEMLLKEAGLPDDRLISEDALHGLDADAAHRPFSDAELGAIDAFLGHARAQAAALFDDLVALARARRAR